MDYGGFVVQDIAAKYYLSLFPPIPFILTLRMFRNLEENNWETCGQPFMLQMDCVAWRLQTLEENKDKENRNFQKLDVKCVCLPYGHVR